MTEIEEIKRRLMEIEGRLRRVELLTLPTGPTQPFNLDQNRAQLRAAVDRLIEEQADGTKEAGES